VPALALTEKTQATIRKRHDPLQKPVAAAIETVDAATGGARAYYMINCAHPTHFRDALKAGEAWLERIRGIRANASSKSHAELDQAQERDAGDPRELAARYFALVGKPPSLNVLGGCCGTDHHHVEDICKPCKN
jgi:homocysteine S-methyltransferase